MDDVLWELIRIIRLLTEKENDIKRYRLMAIGNASIKGIAGVNRE